VGRTPGLARPPRKRVDFLNISPGSRTCQTRGKWALSAGAPLATANGTAQARSDFTATGGVLTFPAGQLVQTAP
jgi:hypothetical protein